MIEGVILAGGASKRALANKLLWKIDDRPLIEHAVNSMFNHVDSIIVVTGYYHDVLNAVLAAKNETRVIFNKEHQKGMFTSIKVGIAATHPQADVFVLPADCPFVKSTTYQDLLLCHDTLAVPTYQGRRGHPLFIPAKHKLQLLSWSDDGNLKQFRNHIGFIEVACDDPNIMIDIDTANDFEESVVTMRKDDYQP